MCWGDGTGYHTNAGDEKHCLQKVDRAGRGWGSCNVLSAGNQALACVMACAAPIGHEKQSVRRSGEAGDQTTGHDKDQCMQKMDQASCSWGPHEQEKRSPKPSRGFQMGKQDAPIGLPGAGAGWKRTEIHGKCGSLADSAGGSGMAAVAGGPAHPAGRCELVQGGGPIQRAAAGQLQLPLPPTPTSGAAKVAVLCDLEVQLPPHLMGAQGDGGHNFAHIQANFRSERARKVLTNL